MKKVIFFGLIISLVIISCAKQERVSPIVGTWQLVYAKNLSMEETFPAQFQGSQIKMWSKKYVTWMGHFELDTLIINNYGGGPSKIEGNRCEVIRQYKDNASMVGTTSRMLIEIRNDTLIQKWPADENWILAEEYNTEKYIRLD